MNAEHNAETNVNLETEKTNKTLKNNNTSFSGSFCLEATKTKESSQKKTYFNPPKNGTDTKSLENCGQNTKQKHASRFSKFWKASRLTLSSVRRLLVLSL
jgi:hypothetical protein